MIWTICSRHYTSCTIQLKIVLSNYEFLRKYLYTNKLNSFHSLVWNLKMLSIHAIIHLSLVQIISPRVISKRYYNIVDIANTCINLSHQLIHFKKLLSIIILKPNKPLHGTLKAFYLIVLLSILEKLTEKVISKRLQVHTIASNFIHPSQLGSIK